MGLGLLAFVILTWFYVFILKHANQFVSWIVLIGISAGMLAFLWMHMVLTAIVVFVFGSFMIKGYFHNKSINNRR